MQNLEQMLFEAVENNTPEEIKKDSIFDYKNEGEFTFKLTQEHVEKLNLWDWFKNYKKEAAVSTTGRWEHYWECRYYRAEDRG